VTDDPEVFVFPNPVANILSLSRPLKAGQYLHIYDAQGKVVITQNNRYKVDAISVEELKPGIYSLLIADDRSTVVRRFVKQ
jgi:hypothetical protein